MRIGTSILAGVVCASAASAVTTAEGAADLSTPARIISGAATAFGPDNYPPDAIRANEQGRVVVLMALDDRGAPLKCDTSVSSMSATLDEATCRIAMLRLRFAPARNRAGHPIASQYSLPVRWILPTVPTLPQTELTGTTTSIGTATAEYATDDTGRAVSCRIVRIIGGAADPCSSFRSGQMFFPVATVKGSPVAAIVTVETSSTARPATP